MDAKGCLPYRYLESQARSDENAKAVPRNRLRFLDFGMSVVPSPALSLETSPVRHMGKAACGVCYGVRASGGRKHERQRRNQMSCLGNYMGVSEN